MLRCATMSLFALLSVALLSGNASALVANDPVAFCTDTGGAWNECGSGCGPATCDNPDPEADGICPTVCTPMCDCPADKPLWAEFMGCHPEKDCGGGEDPAPVGMGMCEQAGGTWEWCGSGCGPYTCDNPPPSEGDEPVACPAVCIEQCLCPGDTPLWDDAEGCIAQSACGGESPQVTLCTETGGSWQECGSGCGPMGCGDDPADFEVCPPVCLEQCGCPESAPLWHGTQGCIAESACEGMSEDADSDGYPASEECDDNNAGVYPGAVEVCNGYDDNCDGVVDEGCDNTPSDEEVLCVTTGGEMADCLSGCAPFSCDNLPTAEMACDSVCVVGCGCPDDAPLWDAESGCYAVSECGDAPINNDELLCESTGGQMGSIDDCAPFTCDNLPGEAEACLTEAKYGCQCPDSAPLWSDETGCFAATECEGDGASDPTALCEATGGEMSECLSGCAPYTCDNPPQEVENCVAVCGMGCQCPADAPLWSDEDGCFAESACGEPSGGTGDGTEPDGSEEPTVPDADDADEGGCQGGAQGPWMLMLAMMVLGWTTRRRLSLEA